jgi:hypothetical protein
MSGVDWYIEGVEFGSCSCAYSCPCQFEALPTHGDCRGFGALRVDKGYFGDVPLDGLKAAMIYAWPGPIFEGKGEMQLIIDERADARQRDALKRILSGEETDEGANHWWVFHAMSDQFHETLYKPIEYEVDINARRGRVVTPGLGECVGRPIVSPVTGQEHRVRIELPEGIEFEVAEIGSATTRMHGAITIELDDTYGQFNLIRHTGRGIVRSRAAAS